MPESKPTYLHVLLQGGTGILQTESGRYQVKLLRYLRIIQSCLIVVPINISAKNYQKLWIWSNLCVAAISLVYKWWCLMHVTRQYCSDFFSCLFTNLKEHSEFQNQSNRIKRFYLLNLINLQMQCLAHSQPSDHLRPVKASLFLLPPPHHFLTICLAVVCHVDVRVVTPAKKIYVNQELGKDVCACKLVSMFLKDDNQLICIRHWIKITATENRKSIIEIFWKDLNWPQCSSNMNGWTTSKL